MEWRERSAVSCEEAYSEAQRWIEAVTKKTFGSNDFRSALENGVLLCDLINQIKPGIIKRVNRLPTPIAGLDNLNIFLRACGNLGLKEAQLFHPGDLQDLSTRVTVKHQETNRRLKNVLITIYWLGRRAQCERFYDGPYLNYKAFEGLLGTALYKALQESSGQKGCNVRDSGFGDSWYSEREELYQLRGGGGGGHRRDNSLDSLDSLGSRPHSISSDTTLKGSSEGCCSDTEADSVFRMAENKDSLSYRRSLIITPKASAQFNQFLPTKDKSTGYVPAPLRKKRAERNEDNRRSWANPMYTEDEGTLTSETRPSSDCYGDSRGSQSASPATHLQWAYEYESGSDSDADRPDPDLVLDDLASRRFHSPSPAPPTNFAIPISPQAGGRTAEGQKGPWPKINMTSNVAPQQKLTCLSSGEMQPTQQGSVRVDHHKAVSTDSLFREIYGDSEEEDDEVGYADPIQDDLYARKMGIKPQPAANESYNKFLPKFWTPEEDVHVQTIKLGSQKRPWYKRMQGFSHKKSGSSSDDSDCDISPWLSSAPSPSSPSPSGPSPSHSHTHKTSAHTTVVVGKRQQQTQESIDGSKSTNDILAAPAVTRQVSMEELQKYREQIKQSDDRWQDDLSKWKNRRKSVNSDIVKKKEEREKIEQITYGNSNKKSKTFKEMQEERESKAKNSIGSRLGSLYYDKDDVFDPPVIAPRTRTLPARGYTIDTPYYSSDFPEPSPKEDKPPAASPATDIATSPPISQEADTVDSAGRDDTTTITPSRPSSLHSPQAPTAAPSLQRSPVPEPTSTAKTEETSTTASSLRSLQKVPEPRQPLSGTQTKAEAPSSGSLYKQQPQLSSMEPKPPGVSRVSASLPRSYQRSDSARLSSVVTPRPFGTQTSRITSLSRTMDDPHKRVNGSVDVSKKASVPSRYHPFMTSEDELQSQSSSAHSSEDEEEQEETTVKSKSVSPVPPQVKSEAPVDPAPAKDTSQVSYCEMRISLNQKPNTSRDFGFQATWDSTGARVTSIHPGSPAEMYQLQVGDEVLMVNGHQVAEMSYKDWKASMEEALQEGSLVMDIRRQGKNNWDRDQPSLPFKSHKIINLTSMDHPILLGYPDTNAVNSSLDFTSRTTTEAPPSKEAPVRPLVDVASNGVNGGFREEPVTMRNKESEPISLKNLKRRSEFFEQGDSGSSVSALVYLCGGSESAVPHIPVPSITPASSRWSWDPEEERKRQEKWQKEQERLLQEKYKRDQEKLQEEWLKAQQEITKKEPQSLEVNSHSISPLSPLSPICQPTPPSWEEEEEEERKRKEEQERQRQAEERRKREEEERELQRLQEERKRQERQEEEERKRREEEELRWQRRREEEEEERRQKEAAEQQRRERERASTQQQWTGGSNAFAKVEPTLSFADRAKSKSSPHLDEEPQRKGVHMQPGGMAHWLLEEQLRSTRDKQARSQRAASELEMERRNILSAMRYREPERATSSGVGELKGQQPASQAELERQQILKEMKKKTPLLTDSSWIRQRAANPVTNKEFDMPHMRRGESLDNLDTSYNSGRLSWTPRSSSYVPNYSRPHSALSGSASFYGGRSEAQPSSTLPSSYSMGSLRGKAGTPTSRSQQLPSLSPSSLLPTNSPEPTSEAGGPQQQSRSVSGKKICTFCDTPLGKGAAMIIESLGLCYHLGCFKCIDCKSDLGGSEAGAEVRIRHKQLYCNSCYMRFKNVQPPCM